MKKYTYLVMTNPVSGREDEYNRWYNEQHLKDVLSVPGFVGAKRFRLVGEDGQWKYLSLYEIEADDVQAALKELRTRSGGPLMPSSEALDRTTAFTLLFEPIFALTSANAE